MTTCPIASVGNIEEHPALSLVPVMRAEEFADLKADIADRGIQVPVELTEAGLLLDGRHRFRAAKELGFEDVPARTIAPDNEEEYVLKAAVLRRHLTDDQRAMMSAMWKVDQPERRGRPPINAPQRCGEFDTPQEATTHFDISRRKHDEATQVLRAAPELAEQVHAGDIPLKKAIREVKVKKREAEDEVRREDLPRQTERYRLIHCEVAGLAESLGPESVDVIITDPPYPEEYLPLFGELARVASIVLKPGGSLLAMSGHSYLPAILGLMGAVEGVKYHWMLAYDMVAGQHGIQWHRQVLTGWKPVLWYVKGDYSGPRVWDVVTSEASDKEHHDWGQSESGMADLVERFSRIGDTILDPFCGAGTTGVVAVKLDRLFIGADNDNTALDRSAVRLAGCVQ